MELLLSIFEVMISNKETLGLYYIIGAVVYAVVGLIIIGNSGYQSEGKFLGFCITIPVYPIMLIMIVIAILYGLFFMESKDVKAK